MLLCSKHAKMALVLVGGLAAVSARHKSELSIRMLVTKHKVTKHKASGDLQHQTVSLVESIPWSGMVIWREVWKRSTGGS